VDALISSGTAVYNFGKKSLSSAAQVKTWSPGGAERNCQLKSDFQMSAIKQIYKQ